MTSSAEYTVTRLEIIDHTRTGDGRVFTKWEHYDFEVRLEEQDEGRTLKIFLSDKEQSDA